jgi:hypothetical protein
MKKILFFLSGIFLLSLSATAQTDADDNNGEKKKVDLEAIKVAFITKKLDLDATEAQSFWPVFNKYEKEVFAAVKDINDDVIKRSEARLAVQKKYKPEFQKVLKTDTRANKVFVIHDNWVANLIKLRNRVKDRQNGQPKFPRRRG